MSGYHTAELRVSRAQIDNWNRAASDAANASRQSEAMRAQIQRVEEQRRRDAENLRTSMQQQSERLNRSVNALDSRLQTADSSIRREILRQTAVQDEKREQMQRRLQEDIRFSEQRAREASQQTNTRIDNLEENIDSISARLNETSNRITRVKHDLEEEIRSTTQGLRAEMKEQSESIMRNIATVRREMGIRLDNLGQRVEAIDGRLLSVERQQEIFMREREIAQQGTQALIDTYGALIADLENNRRCGLFCPTELDSLHSKYEQALRTLRQGLDPVAGYTAINETVMDAVELRARVIYYECHFDELKYELLHTLSDFESISGEDYLVQSVEEGYLFNLDEMSDGKLAEFRTHIQELQARLNDPNCNLEQLPNIREAVLRVADEYKHIVENATLREAAAEIVKAQARELLDGFVRSGFRCERVAIDEHQNVRLIFSRASEGDSITRVVVDINPQVGIDPSTNTPTVSYSYGQRVFVLDSHGQFLEHYDPLIVDSAVATLCAVAGIKREGLNTQDGYENRPADESKYGDVAATLNAPTQN